MSLLAGFNYVFRVRRDKLLDLIQAALPVQGNPLTAPFRLTLPPTTPGPTAKPPPNKLDLIVSSTNLTLEVGTNFCHLHLGLEGGVIRLDDAPAVSFRNGGIDIRMELVNGTLLFVRPLTASLLLPPNTNTAGIADFAARANAEVNRVIDQERGRDFILFPDAQIELTAPLIIGGINRCLSPQVVCACAGGGNVGDLDELLGAKDSFSLGFSAETLRQNLLCRSILSQRERGPGVPAGVFGPLTEAEREMIPPPCGVGVLKRPMPEPAPGAELDPDKVDYTLEITRVSYDFHDGYIEVTGSFTAENTCWEIEDGGFSQKVKLRIEGGRLIPTLEPATPIITGDLDIAWYCFLGMAFLQIFINSHPFMYAVTALDFVSFSNMGMAGPQAPRLPIMSFSEIRWTDVRVTPEGLIFTGDRAGGVVWQKITPSARIRATQDAQDFHATGGGLATVQPLMCPPKEFQYVQFVQDDRYRLSVERQGLFEPVEYVWSVNGEELPSLGKDTLKYVGTVEATVPPPTGTQIPGHSIELSYELGIHLKGELPRGSDAVLTLNARSGDFNYDIRVEVRITDAIGRTFFDAANLRMVGDISEFGADYYEYLGQCLKAATKMVDMKWRESRTPRLGEPQENFADLLNVVVQKIHEGDPAANSLLPGLVKGLGIEKVSKALKGKIR
ncbi:MAG TPA: hypothetical protein VFZ40_07675 [Pyrinomonadaceae bacterium]